MPWLDIILSLTVQINLKEEDILGEAFKRGAKEKI